MNSIPSPTKIPVLQRSDQVVVHDLAGGSIAVRLRAEETGGQLGLVENVIPAGFAGLPPHVHAFDEAFFMLEGELTFRAGDEALTAGAGSLCYIPGAVPHTFAELSGQPARVLIWLIPGGDETYFEVMAAEGARTGGAPSPEFFARLMREHGITPVGSSDPRAQP